jgi:hypothetical protein
MEWMVDERSLDCWSLKSELDIESHGRSATIEMKAGRATHYGAWLRRFEVEVLHPGLLVRLVQNRLMKLFEAAGAFAKEEAQEEKQKPKQKQKQQLTSWR